MWNFSNSKYNDIYIAFRDGKMDEYWRFNKENVAVCRDCEYKYSCSDCSLLEWNSSNDNNLQGIFCDYNVDNGSWESSQDTPSIE